MCPASENRHGRCEADRLYIHTTASAGANIEGLAVRAKNRSANLHRRRRTRRYRNRVRSHNCRHCKKSGDQNHFELRQSDTSYLIFAAIHPNENRCDELTRKRGRGGNRQSANPTTSLNE
jgi:hypothetical protein